MYVYGLFENFLRMAERNRRRRLKKVQFILRSILRPVCWLSIYARVINCFEWDEIDCADNSPARLL